jgi:hypothetical protein
VLLAENIGNYFNLSTRIFTAANIGRELIFQHNTIPSRFSKKIAHISTAGGGTLDSSSI